MRKNRIERKIRRLRKQECDEKWRDKIKREGGQKNERRQCRKNGKQENKR